jgi:hypothetical protein
LKSTRLHGIQIRVRIAQRFSQRIVQGTDRTQTFGRGNFMGIAHPYFDGGVGGAGQILVFFDGDPEGFQIEKRFELFGEFFQHDLEGTVGHIELVALVFHLLDLGNDGLAVAAVGMPSSTPISLALYSTLLLPARSDMSTRRWLPTRLGSMCS